FKRIRQGEGKRRYFQSLLQLDSPLGTWSDFFAREEKVKVPGYSGLVHLSVPNHPGELLGARMVVDEENPGNKNGLPVLYFRDGRRWYFDKEGYLAQKEEGPVTIRYRRDDKHRLKRI